MYLKEIRIYGFKSFADKINLELEKNLNGVVGPNGSGKSNIVDAVRWVLGEQSIKSLRGDNSNDIIFSGSKTRKPLNSATVTLVFDNEDRKLPLDYNEVSIKRTIYRSGENEYYINSEKCRLKDITELLTDSGGSKESFNIISQGKIEEILSTKAIDRRIIFEEAAGVLKYKRRKEEAIRKLDRTNDNLNRINDILIELESSLKPLEIEKDKALEYQKNKNELKNVEISLITNDIEKYNYEYQDSKEKINILNDEVIELTKNNTNYDIELMKEKNNLKKINEEIFEKHNLMLEKVKSLETTKKDIDIFQERKKYAKETNEIEDKSIILNEEILKSKNNITSINNEMEITNQKIDNLSIQIDNKIVAYRGLKDKEIDLNNSLTKNNREENNIKYRIEYLENSITTNNSLPSSIKKILANPKFMGIHNVIGKLFEVEEKYADAINVALGASINYLVVDNRNIASNLVNYLKDNNLGRATFFPLDVIKARHVEEIVLLELEEDKDYIGIASSLVTYKEKYRDIIYNQLGNIIIARDIMSANRLSVLVNKRYKIVTLDGQVVNVGGSITGGSKIITSNLIKEKYELDDAKRKYNDFLLKNKELIKNLESLSKETIDLETEIFKYKTSKNELLEIINNKNKEKNSENEILIKLTKELEDLEHINSNNSASKEKELMDLSYKIKNSIDCLDKEIRILNLEKEKMETSIIETENISKNSNSYISKKEKEINALEIKINRIEVQLDNLLLNLTEEYNMTYESAKEKYKLEIEDSTARDIVNGLKEKIKEIGIVNLGSPQEYERINTRYSFLNSQKEDLKEAENTLLTIINEMDEIMKDKFITTFNQVETEFKKVFKDLFKGGNAALKLTDPENILETGIDIIAEPPGKKLQNISLLSGGEKTFTAISLLFAILNVRPVPFCLLDEVEAALDDANVESFGEYIKKYTDTQFILITHKKKTMEFINTLYGITMQESGVSKLVSVKLEDVKK